MKPLTRRDFVKLSTHALFGLSGILGLGGLVRFFSFHSNPAPPTEFDLGSIDDYPIGSRTLRADIPALIFNKDGEIKALSLTCSHLGCTVEGEEKGEGFTCPCHGSRYDAQGGVVEGPAQKPLRQLRVEILEDRSLKLYTRE
ncbi:MAG: ubiquinol-cytochrome c reductase iron-sulfur subunit [Anaerolineales bacterium]